MRRPKRILLALLAVARRASSTSGSQRCARFPACERRKAAARATDASAADGALDAARPPPPLRRPRRLGRRRSSSRAWRRRELSDLLTNRFTLPGTDSQRAEQILQDHFGQRSTGSFTLVVESDGARAAALVPRGAGGGRARRRELPTGRLVSRACRSRDAVVAAQIVSELEPADSKGQHRRHARGRRDDPGRDASTSRGRPRSSTTSTPSSPRTSRRASSPRGPDRAR